MAVAKAALLKPLKRVEIEVTQKALVIGGGIAGLVASLSLADQGFEVFLVERQNALGGHALDVYYTLEGGDVQKYLKSLIDRLRRHRLIKVYTGAKLTGITGFIGNYRTEIITSEGNKEKIEHGVVIVATGAQEYSPDEYNYGKDERIITQKELERRIVMQDENLKSINTIAMIQCVGSREDEHGYCSRRCCSQAIKNALCLRALDPNMRIYLFCTVIFEHTVSKKISMLQHVVLVLYLFVMKRTINLG